MDFKKCKDCAHSLGFLGCEYSENDDAEYIPETCPDYQPLPEGEDEEDC